jgi:hypothetical protein
MLIFLQLWIQVPMKAPIDLCDDIFDSSDNGCSENQMNDSQTKTIHDTWMW